MQKGLISFERCVEKQARWPSVAPLQLVYTASLTHFKNQKVLINSYSNYAKPRVCTFVHVHAGPFPPATVCFKSAFIFGLVDTPLHLSAWNYGSGNLGFWETYHLIKAESFLLY